MNERFHRKLNRCCLVGVTLISPELITAILTVLIYHHNKSLMGAKHKCNAEIIPVEHPSLRLSPTFEENSSVEIPQHVLQRIDEGLSENDHQEDLFGKLYNSLQTQRRIILKLKGMCKNKLVTLYDMVPYDSSPVREIK